MARNENWKSVTGLLGDTCAPSHLRSSTGCSSSVSTSSSISSCFSPLLFPTPPLLAPNRHPLPCPLPKSLCLFHLKIKNVVQMCQHWNTMWWPLSWPIFPMPNGPRLNIFCETRWFLPPRVQNETQASKVHTLVNSSGQPITVAKGSF